MAGKAVKEIKNSNNNNLLAVESSFCGIIFVETLRMDQRIPLAKADTNDAFAVARVLPLWQGHLVDARYDVLFLH